MKTLPRLYPFPRLKLLPLREQPVYRVRQNSSACSLVELLAAVIGGARQLETAEALLARFTDLRGLSRAHMDELASIPGIGPQTAARLKAALALGTRFMLPLEDRPLVRCPADAAALVAAEMCVLEQEHLKVILLDTRSRAMEVVDIYRGSLNSAQIRIAEVFKPAVQRQAASILVCHNHPAGSIEPSPDDIAVTRALIQAGDLLDIQLVDHLIIGASGIWLSLKEKGLGFS